MQWLIQLDTEKDPIPACRLMNVFRRKGMNIVALAMAAQSTGFSLMALVDTPEGAVEHLFNFLRRTEGVRDVTYYRQHPSAETSHLFVDAGPDSSSLAEIFNRFPESKLIFASQGKYLLELSAEIRPPSVTPGEPGVLPLARVKTTRNVSAPELVRALAHENDEP